MFLILLILLEQRCRGISNLSWRRLKYQFGKNLRRRLSMNYIRILASVETINYINHCYPLCEYEHHDMNPYLYSQLVVWCMVRCMYVTSWQDVLCSTWVGLRRATKESVGVITAKANGGLCANIGVKSTREKSEEDFDSYWWEVQLLSQSEGLERMLERGDNGRQGMERGKDCYWLSVL